MTPVQIRAAPPLCKTLYVLGIQKHDQKALDLGKEKDFDWRLMRRSTILDTKRKPPKKPNTFKQFRFQAILPVKTLKQPDLRLGGAIGTYRRLQQIFYKLVTEQMSCSP